jgi:hypothetical protein
MKNIFLLLAISLFIFSCEDEEQYGFEDFYDAFLIDDIYLEADKTIFFDGDPPVKFIVRANEESTENDIFYFDARIVVNNTDTLDGKEFLPQESGRYNIKAVANNLESNVIAVDYIDRKDIASIKLEYQGYDYLTTYPWSRTGDFILTGTLEGSPRVVNLSKSTIPVEFSDGSSTTLREGYHFSNPGTYDAYVEVNGLRSETYTFMVREQKDYELVTMPIIIHFIRSVPNDQEIARALNSYNEIFNNQDIRYEATFLDNQWLNPNTINAEMKFVLATETPDGIPLAKPGVRDAVTEAGDIDTQEKLNKLIKANNWNANKYINIYVGDLPLSPSASLPILEQERLIGLKTADSDEIFDNDTLNYIYAGNNFYNSNMMGRFFGLYSNYDTDVEIPMNESCPGIIQSTQISFPLNGSCVDDFCDDTYSYDFRYFPYFGGTGVPDLAVVGDTIPGECFQIAINCQDPSITSTVFKVKNIMDDHGVDREFADENGALTSRRTRNRITYDQRERMRFVIDHAINRPTPRNQ